MSKSLGNFFTLTEVFKQYHPSVVRYMLLTVHYRSPLDFSTDILEQSRHTVANLKDAVARMTHLIRKLEFGLDDDVAAAASVEKEAAELFVEFKAALADDLNTPAALGVLHQMIALAEKQFHSNTIHRASVRAALDKFHSAAEILGLDLMPSTRDVLIPGHVTAMAQERQTAREQKNWKESDRLRQAISEAGYVVEDTPQGPRLLPKANG